MYSTQKYSSKFSIAMTNGRNEDTENKTGSLVFEYPRPAFVSLTSDSCFLMAGLLVIARSG